MRTRLRNVGWGFIPLRDQQEVEQQAYDRAKALLDLDDDPNPLEGVEAIRPREPHDPANRGSKDDAATGLEPTSGPVVKTSYTDDLMSRVRERITDSSSTPGESSTQGGLPALPLVESEYSPSVTYPTVSDIASMFPTAYSHGFVTTCRFCNTATRVSRMDRDLLIGAVFTDIAGSVYLESTRDAPMYGLAISAQQIERALRRARSRF